MQIARLLPAFLLLLLAGHPALSASFDAQVVRVKDGDSLIVYRRDVKRQSEIRLAGIDAPELSQPWGIQARSALRVLAGGKPVRIEVTDRDRYGRLIGKMWVARIYVNARMAETGNAWAFRRYYDDKAIRDGQKAAKAGRRGLWSLPAPQRIPPADWREQHPRMD